MSRTADVHEAMWQRARQVDQAHAGEEVLIGSGSRSPARPAAGHHVLLRFANTAIDTSGAGNRVVDLEWKNWAP